MQTINTLIDPLRIFFNVHHDELMIILCVAMLAFFLVMATIVKPERK